MRSASRSKMRPRAPGRARDGWVGPPGFSRTARLITEKMILNLETGSGGRAKLKRQGGSFEPRRTRHVPPFLLTENPILGRSEPRRPERPVAQVECLLESHSVQCKPLFFYSPSGLFIDGQSSQPYCISLETRAIVSQTRRRKLYQQDESVQCVTVNKLFEEHMNCNRIESYRIENVMDVHAPHRQRDMNKLNNNGCWARGQR